MLGSELTNGLANLNYNIYANDINFTYKIAKVKNIKLLKSDFLKPKKPPAPVIKIVFILYSLVRFIFL